MPFLERTTRAKMTMTMPKCKEAVTWMGGKEELTLCHPFSLTISPHYPRILFWCCNFGVFSILEPNFCTILLFCCLKVDSSQPTPFSSPSLYLFLQIEWSSTWIKLSIEYGEDRKHIFREDHFGVIISKHFQTKKVTWHAVLCFLIFLCSRKDVLVGVHEWLPLRENTTMIILSLEVCGGEFFWREN